MFCRNCGAEVNDNQAICLKCGVKAGTGNTFCQNCGNTVDAGASVCLNCGVALKGGAAGGAGDLAGKDKTMMIVICLLLGGLGIHNFMMGETKKGVVKIVASMCFGLGGILALIDLIKICTDKYEVDPTKLF
ncbi:MAG: TM2 domain-containing protein [Oscillospiraceae bacterium]|nr:TM2 domain-containing protein [Oscillospiraceae bacterium]